MSFFLSRFLKMNTEKVIDMIFGVCFKILQLRIKKKKVGSGGEFLKV